MVNDAFELLDLKQVESVEEFDTKLEALIVRIKENLKTPGVQNHPHCGDLWCVYW